MIPKSLIEVVLKQYHDHAMGGHRSRDRLFDTLKTRFYWQSMYSDIKNYVNSCELCLKIKKRAPIQHGLLRSIETKNRLN